MKIPFKERPYSLIPNDCQIIAISVATEINYESVYDFMLRQGWNPRHPGLFVNKTELLPDIFEPVELPKEHISLHQFLQYYPQGRFICKKTGHVFAVINGVKIDHNPKNVKITAAWRVKL